MPEPMVKAEGVHKSFGRLEVLKGIDLELARGQVMCMLGPSGSGKSTFLRCINHLEKINAGRLSVDGELVGYRESGGKLYELHDREVCRKRSEIGMVFQRFNLFPHMTALENVIEAPIYVKGMSRRAAVEVGNSMLERVGDLVELLQKLTEEEKLTLVVVTHEMKFAIELAHQVLVLYEGNVIENGYPKDILANPTDPRTRTFLGLDDVAPKSEKKA